MYLVSPIHFLVIQVSEEGVEASSVRCVEACVASDVPFSDHVGLVTRVLHVLREDLFGASERETRKYTFEQLHTCDQLGGSLLEQTHHTIQYHQFWKRRNHDYCHDIRRSRYIQLYTFSFYRTPLGHKTGGERARRSCGHSHESELRRRRPLPPPPPSRAFALSDLFCEGETPRGRRLDDVVLESVPEHVSSRHEARSRRGADGHAVVVRHLHSHHRTGNSTQQRRRARAVAGAGRSLGGGIRGENTGGWNPQYLQIPPAV